MATLSNSVNLSENKTENEKTKNIQRSLKQVAQTTSAGKEVSIFQRHLIKINLETNCKGINLKVNRIKRRS